MKWTADGRQEPIEDIRKLGLAGAQKIVGGYIELVPTAEDPPRFIICNEEGKLKHLPINAPASRIAGQLIVGDVIVFTREELHAWDDGE